MTKHRCKKDSDETSFLKDIYENPNEVIDDNNDSQEIFDIISKEGGGAVMTSSNCLSGTDRIAEAINNLTDVDPEIIVNIQGDEPLMPTEVIIEIVEPFDNK